MRHVDCMACLTAGVAMPLGTVDASGIVHYVRWAVGGRHGCFRLCDFEGEALAQGKLLAIVDIGKLIPVEGP